MTAQVAAPQRAAGPAPVDAAIARRAFGQLRVGTVVMALAFAGSVYATAVAYAATYPTAVERRQAAALVGSDAGLRVLLGPIGDIATIGGYTVYKNFVFLTSLGAVWALLAGTRLLRGEEDAGRWQLTLGGSTRPGRAVLATLAALGTAVTLLFLAGTAGALLAARNPSLELGAADCVLYGLSLAVVPAVFATVGAVTSQLGRNRRSATSLAMVVFGISFVLRMIGDTGPGARWLLWATPFGWTELIRPFTGNDPWPLLPAVLVVLALGAGAALLAGRRDAGSGVFSTGDTARARRFGLGSVLGLSARLELPTLVAWCVGAAAAGLTFGVFAKITAGAVPDSLRTNLDRYGVHGSFVTQFLGIVFLLVATVVALLPAGQVGAAAAEESSGRLTHLLSRPAHRSQWLLGRLGLTAGAVVVAGVLGGLATWVGARAQGLDLGLVPLVEAGLNVVPTALVALGAGAVMLSLAPRAASATVYALVGWSMFVDLLAPFVGRAPWLDRLSLFHSMALMPGQDPVPLTLVLTTGLGLALCAGATVLFSRRDLRSG